MVNFAELKEQELHDGMGMKFLYYYYFRIDMIRRRMKSSYECCQIRVVTSYQEHHHTMTQTTVSYFKKTNTVKD